MRTSEIPDTFARTIADVAPRYDRTDDPNQEPIVINLPEGSGGTRRLSATTVRVCRNGCHFVLACPPTAVVPRCVNGVLNWQHNHASRVVDMVEALDDEQIIGHVDHFGGKARRQANEAGTNPDVAEWDAIADLAQQWIDMQLLALHWNTDSLR